MTYGGHFDPENKTIRLKQLEREMNEPNFWNDKRHSEAVIAEFNNLKSQLDQVKELKEQIEFYQEALNQEADSLEIYNWANSEAPKIKDALEKLALFLLLNGEYDSHDAVLEIHAGAGGTEACDWANMLYRMYARWAEKKGYK